MAAAITSGYSHAITSSPTPNFRPILPAIRTAILTDSFWTPSHYPHFLARSQSLADGLRDLHIQILEMEVVLSSPPSSDSSSDSTTTTSSYAMERRDGDSPRSLIKIRPSKLAKRQMRLREEERVVVANMRRRFEEAEEIRDRRRVFEKNGRVVVKVRRKKSGLLLRSKSEGALI
jgi:hypothetical protein